MDTLPPGRAGPAGGWPCGGHEHPPCLLGCVRVTVEPPGRESLSRRKGRKSNRFFWNPLCSKNNEASLPVEVKESVISTITEACLSLPVKGAQSCPNLCDPMAYTVHGILQVGIMEWVVGSPTQGSNPGLPHCRWIFYQLSHKGSPRILEWGACPSQAPRQIFAPNDLPVAAETLSALRPGGGCLRLRAE